MYKIKRIIPFLFFVAFVLLLTACSSEWSDVSDTARNLGEQAIRIADDFIDGEITAPVAHSRLQNLNVAEEIPFDSDVSAADSLIRGRVIGMGSNLTLAATGSGAGSISVSEARERIQEARDFLADGLGLRRR